MLFVRWKDTFYHKESISLKKISRCYLRSWEVRIAFKCSKWYLKNLIKHSVCGHLPYIFSPGPCRRRPSLQRTLTIWKLVDEKLIERSERTRDFLSIEKYKSPVHLIYIKYNSYHQYKTGDNEQVISSARIK